MSACTQQSGGASTAQAKETKTDALANAVPVEIALVGRQSISANYSGTATLTADREAQVVAKTSGILVKIYVEEGSKVKSGQLLAKLDEESPRLNLVKAEASLKKLENEYRRSSELFDKKLISSEQHEKVRFEWETQRALYDLAQLELSYTRIVAPIDGVITQRMVKEGNLIQLHQSLFKIDDFDPLLAVLNVPERELNTLQPGKDVNMNADALPGQTFSGKIARISPVVDAATGTFRVTCEFRDKTEQLKSGMFGRLSIVYDQHQNALAIPRTALIEEDGETAVFVVDAVVAEVQAHASDTTTSKPSDPATQVAQAANTKVATDPGVAPESPSTGLSAHRRRVKIGYVDGQQVEIRDGLTEGDKVITVGRNAVRDGTQVQLLEASR